MPSIFAEFPSKHIKAADLGGNDLTLTIERLSVEQIEEGKSETKPVLYFVGHPQGLVLNKTNATTIAEMYGADYGFWPGKPITLYPTTCEFGGRQTDCIRIRPVPAAPPQPQQALPLQPQQWQQPAQYQQQAPQQQWQQQQLPHQQPLQPSVGAPAGVPYQQ